MSAIDEQVRERWAAASSGDATPTGDARIDAMLTYLDRALARAVESRDYRRAAALATALGGWRG